MKPNGKGRIVNKTEAAAIFGVTLVTIGNWIRKGLAHEAGEREVLLNTAAIARFIEAEAAARATASASPASHDIEAARLKKLSAEADLAALELQRQRGEVVLIEEVAKEFGEACAAVRAKLLAIPSKLAARLATEDGESACHRIVADAVHDALTELCADAESRTAEREAAEKAA